MTSFQQWSSNASIDAMSLFRRSLSVAADRSRDAPTSNGTARTKSMLHRAVAVWLKTRALVRDAPSALLTLSRASHHEGAASCDGAAARVTDEASRGRRGET